MTLVVAYAPNERGSAALYLGGVLGRSAGEDLVVCTVVPTPWSPGMARVDAEYQAYLDQLAQEALARARSAVPAGVSVSYVRHHARSAPAGLLEVAAEHAAQAVVLGSSSAGVFGHVALGSVTARMVHSSPVPVALATRGFRGKPGARVGRVTVGFAPPGGSDDLVVAAAGLAERFAASLRLATFVVRPRTMVTAGVGPRAEQEVLAEWVHQVEEATALTLARVGELGLARPPDTVIGHGPGWEEAMHAIDWDEGDVLVLGSSSVGPVARVFLGSRATKIVRHSAVPVVVVPRGNASAQR